MSREIRDTDWVSLSQVQASLSDFVSTVFDGAAIGVELTYGRLFAVRNKPGEAVVMVHGSGGGYCWDEVWERKRLESHLEKATPDDPEVRRGTPTVVWPR